MTQEMTGGCQCGRVRYRAQVDTASAYLCHCRMCQRATGGVFAALVQLPRADVTWTTREPDRGASSPIALRGFCAECGTPLTYEGEGSDQMDLTIGSFDDPSPFRPFGHFGVESRHEAWRDTRALPDTRTDDLPHITAKWIEACGKLPTDTRYFDSFDGVRIAWREMGEGRPVVLLHGYFSDAQTNWIRYGHAAAIAAAGRRVIMPDLRGHGESDRPHDAAAYPPDALAKDGHALIAHLGLTDYDLGGYSLGARTTSRMLATGATPGRIVFSGMGLEGLTDADRRANHFRQILDNLGTHERGSPQWMAEAFLKTTGGDPVALRGVIETFVDTPLATVEAFAQPALVVNGVDDADNGSAAELAAALPDARLVEVPGNHMSSVTKPELGEAIAAFLRD